MDRFMTHIEQLKIKRLEHIIQNDCMGIDCKICPIKRECGWDMREVIAKKELDKIKVEMMQEILRCQI
jgi:hypothetical protein